jgi:hypothetical protein
LTQCAERFALCASSTFWAAAGPIDAMPLASKASRKYLPIVIAISLGHAARSLPRAGLRLQNRVVETSFARAARPTNAGTVHGSTTSTPGLILFLLFLGTTAGRGAASAIKYFLRPRDRDGESSVIASEAKQSSLPLRGEMDCFVASLLAMTVPGASRPFP